MTTGACAVGACPNEAAEEVIVALRTTVGYAHVCTEHGEAIRAGTLEARALPSALGAGPGPVELEPVARG